MKKVLLIILIIIIVFGGFLYIRGKKTATQSGKTTSGFKSFFNFGSKNGTTTETPDNETSSEFTTENPDDIATTPGSGNSSNTNTSIFGTSGPFTPSTVVSTTVGSGASVGGNDGTGGGTIGSGGGVSSGGGVGGSTGGGSTGGGSGGGVGSGGGTTQCSADDTSIEFTPEEIARLQALEARFYALAPALRTDADVQAELANYGSYKLLNQKYAELISYCENKSPLLPNSINRRVATPLYVDAFASAYFVDGPDADGVIDMLHPVVKFKEIEQFFRISIW